MNKKITKLDLAPQILTRQRTAAYARVSCGKDEMLHSLAAQVSFYSELIQSRAEWEYAGVYADEAETGTKDSRPEFRRLIDDCRAGKINLIITKSISRFARNTVDLLQTVRELKALGVGVFFEEQNLNSLSGDGEMLLTILAAYAQEESRSVSENCKWRIRKDFKEGKAAGHMHIYGYDCKAGKLTVNPAEVFDVLFVIETVCGLLSVMAHFLLADASLESALLIPGTVAEMTFLLWLVIRGVNQSKLPAQQA